MVEKILNCPEIWKIYVELPDSPLKNLNSYVIRSGKEALIVDTGYNRPECREALWNGIRELELDLKKTALFLTHMHSDHIGLAGDFMELGCRIYMSEDDYEVHKFHKLHNGRKYIDGLFRMEGFPQHELDLQLTKNHGRLYNTKEVLRVETVRDGSIIQVGNVELTCISTPGHTPGHMMLYISKDQVVFTGDHILFDITPNIAIWTGVPLSLESYLESLEKSRQLKVKTALPGHRTAHIGYYERIDQLIDHHTDRLVEICQAVKKYGPATAYEIASRITWSMRGKDWSEFPVHQKWFAMGETLAHLYLLCNRGMMDRKKTENGILYELI